VAASGTCRADAAGSDEGANATHYVRHLQSKPGQSSWADSAERCRKICRNYTWTHNQTCYGIEHLFNGSALDYCDVWVAPILSVASQPGGYACELHNYSHAAGDAAASTPKTTTIPPKLNAPATNTSSSNSSSSNSSSGSGSGTVSTTVIAGSGAGGGGAQQQAGGTVLRAAAPAGDYAALAANATLVAELKDQVKRDVSSALSIPAEKVLEVNFYEGSIITEVVLDMTPSEAAQAGAAINPAAVAVAVQGTLKQAGVCADPCTVTAFVVEEEPESLLQTNAASRAVGFLAALSALPWL